MNDFNVIPFPRRGASVRAGVPARGASAPHTSAPQSGHAGPKSFEYIWDETHEKLQELGAHWFMVIDQDVPSDRSELDRIVTVLRNVVLRMASQCGGQEQFKARHRGVSVILSQPGLDWQPTQRLQELHVPNSATADQLETFIRRHIAMK